ncbi:hypothetical protein ACH4VR_29295 [Streptomyces sp. NPDC020883]|uniref:hypothetical protein n=1 Tax=Streptomyces sp. NPDC020883 TaxID=3365099 RepID=UPI003791093C
MFTLVTALVRNGPLLLFVILPFLLLTMGLGSFGWAAITYGPSVHLLPGLSLVLLGKGLAHLGTRHHRMKASTIIHAQS